MSHEPPLQVPDPAPVALDPLADPASWAPSEAPVARCPWCSATLPSTDLADCPSCRAQLRGEAETAIPGLTDVVQKPKPATIEPVKRNRLLAWISGDVVDDPMADPVPESGRAALSPPSADVRREILRIQLEAAGLLTAASNADGTVSPSDAGDSPAAGSELTAP